MRRLNDEGVTLIELLVSMVVLGIIVGAITEGIFVGLRTENSTTQRLVESHDAQMVSSLFVTDVQSAGIVLFQVSPWKLTFTWTDPSAGAETVSYAVQSQTLVRQASIGGTTTNVVAAHLLGTTLPTVLCDGAPCAASSTPRTVSISAQALGSDGTSYAYTLQAARRQT